MDLVREAWLDFILLKSIPPNTFSSLPTELDTKAPQTQAKHGLPTATSSGWEMRQQVVTLMGPSLFK